MKKFVTLVCMIACIFGLTACGSEEELTEYEQQKLAYAKQLASNTVVPMLAEFMDDETAASFDVYTVDEIEYLVNNQAGVRTEGYAFMTAIESFHSAADSVGTIVSVGEATASIDGNQIIVEVNVTGTGKDAVAEVIFSNDMFMTIESAALNPMSSVGELMTNAALNTLIGMGTVFVVLILISCIISCFNIIPKLQKSAAEKKAGAAGVQEKAVVNHTAPAVVASEDSEDDDQELVAVIAAAIAAYEGSATTDGFVVRSIRRHR